MRDAGIREIVRVEPFTAMVDRLRSDFYVSYAMPDAGTGVPEAAARLPELEDAFRSRGRIPRLQFIEDLFADLPPVLEARGWRLTERIPILVCEARGLRPPPPPDGVEIRVVSTDAPVAMVRDLIQAQRDAFGDPQPVSDDEVERWYRRDPRAVRAIALREGAVVGAATALPAGDGIAEVVGVATLPVHRRRGIGSALTAEVTAGAFAGGAQLVWLSAADETATRIYERLGFVRAGTQVGYNSGRRPDTVRPAAGRGSPPAAT